MDKRVELTFQKMGSILDQSQKTFAAHSKCLKMMKRLFFHCDDSLTFRNLFVDRLKQVLVVGKREPPVERIVQFIVHFVPSLAKVSKADMEKEAEIPSDDEEEDDAKRSPKRRKVHKEKVSPTEDSTGNKFCSFIMGYLLKLTGVKDKAVRFRSCQIINGMLAEMADIDNSLWDEIEDKMMKRLQDKFPLVRTQAVGALSRLQNPRNKSDVVVNEYLKILKEDSCKDVRKAVLASIGLTRYTLGDVLQRTRDVHDEVRKATYVILGKKVPVEKFSLEQRITLLTSGLNDRNEGVREACIKMVAEGWLKRTNSDVVELLNHLQVEKNEEIVEQVLKHLIKELKSEPEFDVEHISPEKSIYWRMYCQNLRQEKREEELEGIMPDITDFCNIITVNLMDEFITSQLFLMARLLDFSDEVGRRVLSALLCKLIPNPESSDKLRINAMKLLHRVHPDESDYVRVVLEIISEIQDPLESNVPNWNKEAAKKQMWMQCLAITAELLENTTKDLSDGGISGLLHSVILPAVQNPSSEVRNIAVKCLGLYCMLGLDQAKAHLLLLLQIIKNDKDSIKLTAIKIVFDFVMVFGFNSFQDQDLEDVMSQDASQSQSDSTFKSEQESAILSTLGTYLTYLNSEIRTTVVEGFAKLFFTDIVGNPRTLSKLFVTFFDPITEGDLRLRQCLSIFFPMYASRSTMHRDTIEKSFTTTLAAFLNAPKRSMLTQVSISQVAQFLLHLLGGKEGAANPHHDRLSTTIAFEILTDPNSAEAKQLCKVLPMLHLTKNTPQETIKKLEVLTTKMQDQVDDKLSLKQVEKFLSFVKSLNQNPGEVLDEDAIAEIKAKLAHEEHPVNVEEDKADKFLKHQKDYFAAIDDFELSMETPEKKKKVPAPKPKEAWEIERERLMEQRAKMEEELLALRRIVENKKTDGGELVAPEESDSRKRKIRFADEVTPRPKESQPIVQRSRPPPVSTPPKKPVSAVPAKVVTVKKPSPPIASASPLAQRKEVDLTQEDEVMESTPASSSDSFSPFTQRTPPVAVVPQSTSAEEIKKRKSPEVVTKGMGPPSKKTKNAVEPAEQTARNVMPDRARGTLLTERTRNILQEKARSESLENSLEDESSQPIPEISELIPSSAVSQTGEGEGNTEASPDLGISKITRVVVSFSGFKLGDKLYNLKYRDDLIDRIHLLGGEARTDEVFDAAITHVITPPYVRTMKTLAASLTCRFLVTPQWVYACTAAKRFVLENQFGNRKKVSPFHGKNVYITPAYKLENRDKSFKDSNYKALIEQLGRGKLLNYPDDADIILIGNEEGTADYKASQYFTWNQFFDMIQPPPKGLTSVTTTK